LTAAAAMAGYASDYFASIIARLLGLIRPTLSREDELLLVV